MKRAVLAVAVFAGLVLLLGMNAAPWLAITGSVMALTCAGIGGAVYQARRHMVRQWGTIRQAETCQECKGWGVLDKNKQPFRQDPRTLAHVMWVSASHRRCRQCQGRGFYTPRQARKAANKTPGAVTILADPSSPEDVELIWPAGPAEPPVIEPTSVIPPGWWKKGGKQ